MRYKSSFILSFLILCGMSLFFCAEETHAARPFRPRSQTSQQPAEINNQISGVTWMDENADGRRDHHESGLANVVVELHTGACGQPDGHLHALAVTDRDGIYTFSHFSDKPAIDETPFCLRVDEHTLPTHLILSTARVALDVNPASATEPNADKSTHNHISYDFGYAPLFAHDQLVVGLHSCHDPTWLTATAAQHNADAVATSVGGDKTCTFSLTVPPKNQAALRTQLKGEPTVAFVERDVRVRGQFTPNDPDYNNSALVFAPQQINSEQAWDESIGDPELIIAVLDTGIDFGHEEFTGRLLAGHDYVNNDSDPADDSGHGTHVAGIAGAEVNNGLGIAGMAGASKLLPMKVLNQNNLGWWSDVATAIIDAVDQDAKVINLSISSTYGSSALENALQYAADHDVLVVAAAGNQNSDEPRYPTAYPHANLLRVGATKYDGERWALSNFGVNVDILAPGQFIHSTHWRTDTNSAYGFMTGTSMATPHVAGVAALLLSIEPALTLTATIEILATTATDIGDPGFDELHGHGRIDAGAAVQALLPPPVEPGDCNADVDVDAGDLSALTLEIFDGDGNLADDAHGGTYPGSGPGCNANGDDFINAGDLSCVTLTIFNGPGACNSGTANGRAVDTTMPAPSLVMPAQVNATSEAPIQVPLRVVGGGAAVNALTFSIDIEEGQLAFDPRDNNGDGMPDAVRVARPDVHAAQVIYNPTDRDGELDITLFTLSPDASFGEEPLITVAFTPKELARGSETKPSKAALQVALDPPPSAGDRNGHALELTPGAPLRMTFPPPAQSSKLFLPLVESG